MQKINHLIRILLCVLALSVNLQAQNPANVDVNKLSDQQIQQIVTEVNSRGLSIDEATQMAQLKGASPIQIEQLKRRIQELNFSKGTSIANPTATTTQKSTFSREAFSEKAALISAFSENASLENVLF